MNQFRVLSFLVLLASMFLSSGDAFAYYAVCTYGGWGTFARHGAKAVLFVDMENYTGERVQYRPGSVVSFFPTRLANDWFSISAENEGQDGESTVVSSPMRDLGLILVSSDAEAVAACYAYDPQEHEELGNGRSLRVAAAWAGSDTAFRAVRHLLLGTLWVDPNGLKWSNVLRVRPRYTHAPKALSHEEAETYCQSKGAELPSEDHYQRLIRQLSTTQRGEYVAQVLPMIAAGPTWSSEGKLFDGYHGKMQHAGDGQRALVRCVIPPSP